MAEVEEHGIRTPLSPPQVLGCVLGGGFWLLPLFLASGGDDALVPRLAGLWSFFGLLLYGFLVTSFSGLSVILWTLWTDPQDPRRRLKSKAAGIRAAVLFAALLIACLGALAVHLQP